MHKFSRLIPFLYVLFHFTNGYTVQKQCFETGITWSTEGELIAIPGVDSALKCFEFCIKEDKCQGYTWHGKTNLMSRIDNLCILFEVILFNDF